MHHSISISITRADDAIRAYMSGGKIPVIAFGDSFADNASIQVNTDLLSRAEQGAWLDRLAEAAADLAAQVRAAALAEVSS